MLLIFQSTSKVSFEVFGVLQIYIIHTWNNTDHLKVRWLTSSRGYNQFNFNFNLFILYHIHQYHEYIVHTFTYVFTLIIVWSRIKGPIWPIRSFSNGTFTFRHHIMNISEVGTEGLWYTGFILHNNKLWLQYAGCSPSYFISANMRHQFIGVPCL